MVEKKSRKLNWKIVGTIAWLIFTLSMAGWWLYLGLSFLDQLGAQQGILQETIAGQRNMLLWEGMAWMVFLLGGGMTLIYLIDRERKSTQALRGFLASFSHDIKTALTSLQLQAEIIREQAGDLSAVRRLDADVVRLQLQLENSLFLASEEDLQFFIEDVSLKRSLNGLIERWPGMKIELIGEAFLRVDRRALKSIITNILQNSMIHGRAKQIRVEVKPKGVQKVEVCFIDDGRGFKGNWRHLGDLFDRHNPSSGSGVGLYTVTQLIRKMGGDVSFSSSQQGGFKVHLVFEGSVP